MFPASGAGTVGRGQGRKSGRIEAAHLPDADVCGLCAGRAGSKPCCRGRMPPQSQSQSIHAEASADE